MAVPFGLDDRPEYTAREGRRERIPAAGGVSGTPADPLGASRERDDVRLGRGSSPAVACWIAVTRAPG